MKRLLISIILALIFPIYSTATTYYVRTDGNNGNTGLANTAGGAWLTIDYAADHVAAGDTVRVQTGTYGERVTPAINGSSGSPITFVDGRTTTFCGVTLSSSSYLRFIGFVMDGNAGGCSQTNLISVLVTSDHIEFWNNTIRDGTYSGLATSYPSAYLNNSIFLGNNWTTFGNYEDNIVYMFGSHTIFAYNEWSYKECDVANVEGTTYNRWLNNYVHDLTSSAGCHSDEWQVGSSASGWSRNLYEAHLQLGVAGEQEHTTNISNAQSDRCGGACGAHDNNIFRFNVFHNVGGGSIGIGNPGDEANPSSNLRFYNNDEIDIQRTDDTNRASDWVYSNATPDPGGYWLNNIEYEAWGSAASNPYVYYIEGPLVIGYNLGYDSGGAQTFTDPFSTQTSPQLNVNPQFNNYGANDFTLGVTSGAIGTAGPLTTTSGGGTGTTFNVAAGGGGFFVGSDATNLPQYGGALVPGDTITVGTDVVTVVSIATDAITVTPSFTWANGESVYFGSDTTPDIGAYPYKATGYTISATYVNAAGTVTVTPADSSIVRYVICYEDGIPVGVDSVSPYTCTVGAGTLDIRVYPLYASSTLYTAATLADTTNPTVIITSPTSSPTYATSTAAITIQGTCTDNVACTSVTWTCDICTVTSGTATGTGSWSQTLTQTAGANTIVVTGHDYATNTGTDQLVSTYTAPGGGDLGPGTRSGRMRR